MNTPHTTLTTKFKEFIWKFQRKRPQVEEIKLTLKKSAPSILPDTEDPEVRHLGTYITQKSDTQATIIKLMD